MTDDESIRLSSLQLAKESVQLGRGFPSYTVQVARTEDLSENILTIARKYENYITGKESNNND